MQLPTHVGNILFGSDARMLACLHGILLRRKAEGVITHGMQHIVALHAPITAHHVGCKVSKRMPHVQTFARGEGEHVHGKE